MNKVTTGTGKFDLAVPRDRQSNFDPQLIARYQWRFPGFDESEEDRKRPRWGVFPTNPVDVRARVSTRKIVGHLQEPCGVEVAPDLIPAVTDAVPKEVGAWRSRPLEAVHPIVFLDAPRVKVRDEGFVRNEAVHIALGVRADGAKEILGLCFARERRQFLAPGHDGDEEHNRRENDPRIVF